MSEKGQSAHCCVRIAQLRRSPDTKIQQCWCMLIKNISQQNNLHTHSTTKTKRVHTALMLLCSAPPTYELLLHSAQSAATIDTLACTCIQPHSVYPFGSAIPPSTLTPHAAFTHHKTCTSPHKQVKKQHVKKRAHHPKKLNALLITIQYRCHTRSLGASSSSSAVHSLKIKKCV